MLPGRTASVTCSTRLCEREELGEEYRNLHGGKEKALPMIVLRTPLDAENLQFYAAMLGTVLVDASSCFLAESYRNSCNSWGSESKATD